MQQLEMQGETPKPLKSSSFSTKMEQPVTIHLREDRHINEFDLKQIKIKNTFKFKSSNKRNAENYLKSRPPLFV